MDEKKIQEAYKELAKIVGEKYVSMDKEDIMPYCRMRYPRHSRPIWQTWWWRPARLRKSRRSSGFAIRSSCRLSYAYGVSISSTALPRVGADVGVRRLDKIIEINDETHTATIEPGTWSKLFLRQKSIISSRWVSAAARTAAA